MDEYQGLLPLVQLMSIDDKLVFLSDKKMLAYWHEDIAWAIEYKHRTPSKIRKHERRQQLENRQTEYS
jgi:ketosteroid isomerase-like protein